MTEASAAERAIGFARPLGDQLFDADECPGVDDRPLKVGDLVGAEIALPDELVEVAQSAGAERRARVGDEQSALAFAKIVAHGLARDGAVTEDSEDVVAQLEGEADGVAEGRKCAVLLGVSAGERGTELKRVLHAVPRRLQGSDTQRAIGVGVGRGRDVRGLLGDIEELTDRHFTAHASELGAGPMRTIGFDVHESFFEQVVAPRDEEIAEEDRGGSTELLAVSRPTLRAVVGLPGTVGCRTSPTCVGPVDDVVVDERGGVEDLERRGRGDHRVGGRRNPSACRGHSAPAGEAEAGPERLAPGRGGGSGIHESACFVAEAGGRVALRLEEPLDSLGNGDDRVVRGGHRPSLVIARTRTLDGPNRGGCMPLSEQEQRLLDEMERHLMRNDADVVSADRGAAPLSYRNIVYGSVIVLLGIAGLVVGVATSLIVIGVIAFVLMVGGVVLAFTPAKGAAAARNATGTRKPRAAKAAASASFMDRMNDRWDRRNDDR